VNPSKPQTPTPGAGKDAGARPALPELLQRGRQLTKGESFCFGCRPQLACFTSCCANVNILLTPADVLSLARRTGLSTRQFLDRHALIPLAEDLRLPIVMLRMDDTPEKRCPFVSPTGCSVYDARPWACRMYPLGMALPPARAGVEPEPSYFLLEDDHCQGRGEPERWTVEAWQRDQGVEDREVLERGFRELVSHPWFIGGRQLDPRRIEMFFTATYDLDTFREFIFSTRFLERFVVDDDLVETLRSDDRALLRFGFRWLRLALFGEPTLQVRQAARRAEARP
jgi:Fe-S-cluster containining protein